MDIVNWDYLQKLKLIRSSIESTDDLVLIGANVTYNKRGDQFQSYAVPVSVLAQATAQGLQAVISSNSNLTADNTIIGNDNPIDWAGNSSFKISPNEVFYAGIGDTKIEVLSNSAEMVNTVDTYNSVKVDYRGVYIQTPEISLAQSGYVPTLADNTTGKIEYRPIPGNPIFLDANATIDANSGIIPINNLSIPVVTGKSYRFSAHVLYNVNTTAVNSAFGIKTATPALFSRSGCFVTWKDNLSATVPISGYCDLNTNITVYSSGSQLKGLAIIEGALSNALEDGEVGIVASFTSSGPSDTGTILAGASLIYYEF
jgi:hypothetical protein